MAYLLCLLFPILAVKRRSVKQHENKNATNLQILLDEEKEECYINKRKLIAFIDA